MARGNPQNRPSFRRALSVFESRNYRILWASSAFSFTGMQMQQVARALLAWELTESFGAVGAVSLSFGLPMLLFSLIGGSLADRFEKRNLTLMTQVSTGILALLTAVAIFTGVITIEMLFVIGLVQGTFFALGMPARTPLMADAVKPEEVLSAIAMSQAAMNTTRLVGPALAGIIVGVWGVGAAYMVQSSMYVISASLLLLVPTGLGAAAAATRRGMPGAQVQGTMFVEIGRGIRYVATEPRLRLLIGMMFIVSFFAMPYIMLLAGFVHDDLNRGDTTFGLLQSITGVGAVVGSFAIASLTEFDRKPLLQWLAGIMVGIGLVVLALGTASFGLGGAIAAVIVLGLATTAYQTLNNTMVMDAAKPEYYGRVMSINMLTFSSMPLMAFPLGALADVIGARETFLLQAGVVLAFMAVLGVTNAKYIFGRLAPRAHTIEESPAGASPDGDLRYGGQTSRISGNPTATTNSSTGKPSRQ